MQTRFADEISEKADFDEITHLSQYQGWEKAKEHQDYTDYIFEAPGEERKPIADVLMQTRFGEVINDIEQIQLNEEGKLPTCDKWITFNCQPVCSETLTKGCTEARTPHTPDPYRYQGPNINANSVVS